MSSDREPDADKIVDQDAATDSEARTDSGEIQLPEIEHHQFVRLLGRGGMGVVYLAKDELLDRQVAVKILAPGIAADRVARARFLREARSMAAVEIPHILRVFSIGETAGQVYLTMQYATGETLATRISAGGKLPLAEALEITRQIVEALSAADERNIVHRDIKPANVFFDADDAVLVGDFGLARGVEVADDAEALTMAGQLLGTPHYSSPEQALGSRVDFRTDIYSLGIVVFEMLSGQRPFSATSFGAVIGQHIHSPLPKLAEIVDVRDGVQALVEWMTAKEPGDRPDSYADLSARLSALIAAGEEEVAAQESPQGVGNGTVQAGQPQVTFRLCLDTEADGFRVTSSSNLDRKSQQTLFDFDLSSGARTEDVLRSIRVDQCSVDDLKDIGIQLWSGLAGSSARHDFGELIAGLGNAENLHVRLSLPDELEHLPWESLYDREFGFLAAHPKLSLVRDVDTKLRRELAAQHDLPARVLVIIPSGSELQVEQEWDGLCRAVEVVKDRIELERLDGQVTPDALRAALHYGNWDVVHYIGHGELDSAGKPKIRLNSEDPNGELWLEGEPFSSLFLDTSVRLVVLNCCLAGAGHPERTLSGIGRLLREKGVPAVVAMQYEIADHIALRFSREFYRQLFSGEPLGRVDLAMAWARGAIFLNMTEETCRAFVTPVMYMAEEAQKLFSGHRAEEATAHLVKPGSGATVEVPEGLVEDIRQGNCLLVLGPEILHADQDRGEAAPPGPGALAQRVADLSSVPYPEPRDFELSERGGLWMKRQLLQWVCQHFMAVESQGPFELARSIRGAYDSMEPTGLMRSLSSWNVPGFICTHFDALLEEALRQRNKGVVVANSLSTSVTAEGTDHPMVAYLRGTVHDPNSLVLTEEDHHGLYESLSAMSPVIVDLVRGRFGRSILVLGETPRDFILQRLAMQLIDPKLRTQGPCYFLRSSSRERNDHAWSHLNVRWIDADLSDFVFAIDARLAGKP